MILLRIDTADLRHFTTFGLLYECTRDTFDLLPRVHVYHNIINNNVFVIQNNTNQGAYILCIHTTRRLFYSKAVCTQNIRVCIHI